MATKVSRLQVEFNDFANKLGEELGITNVMEIPKLEKVVVNIGQGEAVQNVKVLESAVSDLQAITGQKPILTKARKSIAGFKLRQGMPIGTMVTLRGVRMYEFLDRLINVSIPRVRDFRGYSTKSFDGHGNYSLGVKEQIVFPEINYDQVDKIRGVGITIQTTAQNDIHAKALLEKFKFPFRK